MRSTYVLAALATTTIAAPTPSLLGDIIVAQVNALKAVDTIIKTVVTDTVKTIAQIVSTLDATLQTNAASHGNVWNYLNIKPTAKNVSSTRYSHSISWTKSSS